MKLTQREIAPSLGYQDIVHVVLVNDTTQDTYGSSYKGTIQQIIDLAPKDSYVTGGTHNQNYGITTFTNSTGTTFDVGGYFKPSDDIYVTGGTYVNNTGIITFQNNKDGLFQVDGFFKPSDDIYVSGVTFNPFSYSLTISRNDGTNFLADLSVLSNDVRVTGGTYNPSNGIATFTNNSGSTFNVTGFLTGMTDTFVVSGSYNQNLGVATFTNNSGGTFNVSGYFKPSDDIYVSGVTFNQSNYGLTISRNDGTNFLADLSVLSNDVRVTGGTYNPSNGIATFTNNSGSTFNVTGFLTGMTDTFVVSGTYNQNAGVATFTNNSGGTFNVSGFYTGTTIENLQKEITTTNYQLTSADNNYTILINNGSNPVTITVPAGLMSKINVGFIQQGTGEVNFLASSTTINSPLNMLKIKGQNYWAYLEQVTNTNVYHLVGSLKV